MTATIIAEIGLNHLGSLDTAKALATMAAERGADVIKSQLIMEPLTHEPEDQALLDRCSLTRDEWREWVAHVRSLDKEPLFSVFDKTAVALAVELGCERLKIASPDAVNKALILAATSTQLPLLISTGAIDFDEIVWAPDSTTWLHCVSAYPAPIETNNLGDHFKGNGLSDHSPPGETIPAIMAVALGATVIERHVRGWYPDEDLMCDWREGFGRYVPDHAVSDNPDQFSAYVQAIRKAESAMGDGVKRVQECEEPIRKYARRGPDGLRPRRTE